MIPAPTASNSNKAPPTAIKITPRIIVIINKFLE